MTKFLDSLINPDSSDKLIYGILRIPYTEKRQRKLFPVILEVYSTDLWNHREDSSMDYFQD